MLGSRFTVRHVSPASSVRHNSPSSFVSLSTYTMFGSLGATATPMRSIALRGRPFSLSGPERRSQVCPPFTDFHTDVFPDPDARYHAQRR